MKEEDIRKLIKEEFKKNYSSGVPEIAPHQHDGVDNLQVNPINFLGYPVFTVDDATVEPSDMPITGTIRFQFDGTNFTMWVRNGQNWNQVGSGGGGGSPGGNDTNVQFNDGGSFGGSDTFDFDKNNNILTLDDGSGADVAGFIITGGTSDINIITNDNSDSSGETSFIYIYNGVTSGDDATSGGIYIDAGDSSGSNATSGGVDLLAGNAASDGYPGSINIAAGKSGTVISAGVNDGGSISIVAGSTGEATGGDVTITSGSATTSGDGGRVIITLGGTDSGNRQYFQVKQFDAFGTIQPNIGFGSSVDFASGQGVVYIRNRTTAPSGTPSTGGVLYVESGALHYKGSSGTDTTIASA